MTGRAIRRLYHNIWLSRITIRATSTRPAFYYQTDKYGSQWNNDGNDGDASLLLSVNDNWAYSLTDATNLYNHPDFYTAANAAMDVKKGGPLDRLAQPDYVVVYDRATTGHAGRYKQLNLALVAAPSISGNTARAVKGGQAVTVQSLLPAAPRSPSSISGRPTRPMRWTGSRTSASRPTGWSSPIPKAGGRTVPDGRARHGCRCRGRRRDGGPFDGRNAL